MLKDIDAYQEMPAGKEKEAVEARLRRRILEYNRNQFKLGRSQQRPNDLGFAKQQWFDTEEAFGRVMRDEPGRVVMSETREGTGAMTPQPNPELVQIHLD